MAEITAPNPWKNSGKIRASRTGVGRGSLEIEQYTEHGAVKTYPNCEPCNYDHGRTGITANEADPTIASSVWWDFIGFKGVAGHLQFTGGTNPTADIVLWAKDTQNSKLVKVATVSNVGDQEEFLFSNNVRGRWIVLQVIGLTGSPTSVDLHACRI